MNEVMDMMTKNQTNEREQLEILTIEQLVPQGYRQYASAPSICATCPVIDNASRGRINKR